MINAAATTNTTLNFHSYEIIRVWDISIGIGFTFRWIDARDGHCSHGLFKISQNLKTRFVSFLKNPKQVICIYNFTLILSILI